METLAEEELRAMMDSLYFGPTRLVRSVLPHMRKRKYGVIVNISSGAALEGRDSMGGYAGAKAALDGMPLILTVDSIIFLLTSAIKQCPRFSPKRLRRTAFVL